MDLNLLELNSLQDVQKLSKALGYDHHVSEIYNPSRFTKLSRCMGLHPGYALDLTVRRANGDYWDFTRVADRLEAKELLMTDRPLLLVGSPVCTAFSSLMKMN